MGKLVTLLLTTSLLTSPAETAPQPPPATSGSVAVFIAPRLYQDEEFDPIVRQLTRAGFAVVTVSVETTAVQSMDGYLVKPKQALRDVRPSDYAALVLIGGSGITVLWDDSLLHAKCREFAAAGRVVAAIGIAPIALARAGILKGRRATVVRDISAIGLLRAQGCRYSFNRVVTDGTIVTAASAVSAKPFARAVIQALRRR